MIRISYGGNLSDFKSKKSVQNRICVSASVLAILGFWDLEITNLRSLDIRASWFSTLDCTCKILISSDYVNIWNKNRQTDTVRISYGENKYKFKRSESLKNCAVWAEGEFTILDSQA